MESRYLVTHTPVRRLQGGRREVADGLLWLQDGRKDLAHGGFACCKWNLSGYKLLIECFLVVAMVSAIGRDFSAISRSPVFNRRKSPSGCGPFSKSHKSSFDRKHAQQKQSPTDHQLNAD